MRFLDHARARARGYRVAFCADPGATSPDGTPDDPRLDASHLWSEDRPTLPTSQLLERALACIRAARILIEADDGGTLQGAQAVLSKHLLVYDGGLDAPGKLHEKLLVFHHELGHVDLHEDLIDRVDTTVSILEPGAWSNAGAVAARYSRQAMVEAEANAFAAELICPADSVFELWRQHPDWSTEVIAERLDLPVDLVRVQLAEGLGRWVEGRAGGEEVPANEARRRRPNPRQDEAVRSVAQPTLINAGPGTGKTATLARHTGFLLDTGTDPRSILALTFSNEAADELRSRVEDLHGRDVASRITIATFHGFGYQLLLHYGYLAGLKGEPRVLDTPAQEELLSEVLGRTPCAELFVLRNPRETAEEARRQIAHLKNALVTPDDLEVAIECWTPADAEEELQKRKSQELLGVYRAYEAAKRPEEGPCTVDFGDLILLPFQILRDHVTAKEEALGRWRWLIVDEYQDAGRGVAPFLRQLTGPGHLPWAVGDPRQSIHRFRGAAPENLRNFARDFEHAGDAAEISLQTNYRSAPGIVRIANQLATLMEDPDHEGPETEFWIADEDNPADVDSPFSVAIANCDAAERYHIVDQVRRWIRDARIDPREIAVLARTNQDVRLLGLALRQAGIPVSAGGVVTAEGAGGDLAAVVLLPDGPRMALPRVAFALGRSAGLDPDTINSAIRGLLDTESAESLGAAAAALMAETISVRDALGAIQYVADPWRVLMTFLFDSSPYLRRFLEGTVPEAELALDEIVTALGVAAGHRFARRGLAALESRLFFGEHFRRTLVRPTESVESGRSSRNAVQVMTCHASKGLQFPYVVVAGQIDRTPANREGKRVKPRYPWLPPGYQPDPREEQEQADSVLFVAVTRAERQAIVSFAATANDRPKSPRRPPVPLLARWLDRYATVQPMSWNLGAPEAEEAAVIPLWGTASGGSIPVRHLADDACAILAYLEVVHRMRVPTFPKPLYPEFIGRGRSALLRVVERAIELGTPVPTEVAAAIFEAAWPQTEHPDHPHAEVYRSLAQEAVLAFAAEYVPAGEILLNDLPDVIDEGIALGLVALLQDQQGSTLAIGFRAESLAVLSKDGATIPWGELKGSKRLPFALSAGATAALQARVFSARDGRSYAYAINPRYLPDTLDKARARRRALHESGSRQAVKLQTCERCGLRVSCPHWMGLLPPVDASGDAEPIPIPGVS